MAFRKDYESEKQRLQQEELKRRQKEAEEAREAARRAQEAEEKVRRHTVEQQQAIQSKLNGILRQADAAGALEDARREVWGRGQVQSEYRDFDREVQPHKGHAYDGSLYVKPSSNDAARDEYDKGNRQRAKIELHDTYPTVEDHGDPAFSDAGADGLGGSYEATHHYVGGKARTNLSISAERTSEKRTGGYNGTGGDYQIAVEDSVGGREVIKVDPNKPVNPSEVRQAVARVSARRAQEQALPDQLERKGREEAQKLVPKRRTSWWRR